MKKVIRFTAEWCSPCRALAPMIEEIKQESPGVEFETVDIDENTEFALKMGIRSIPVVIVENDGVETHRFVGIHPRERYVDAINN